MSARSLLVVSIASLAAAGLTQQARADIYTWVDASGMMTVSNVEPPEGVKVTRVLHTSAQSAKASAAAAEASRAAQVRELTERVRELEQEVQSAKNAPAPDFAYPPMMPPPAPYAYNRMPPPQPPQYVMDQPPPSWNGYGSPYGCDPMWAGCYSSFGAPFVYPSVVVVQPGRHHHHPSRGGGRPPSSHGPMLAARTR